MNKNLEIKEATTTQEIESAKEIMLEYMQVALGDDYNVGGAGLKEELQNFPGPYKAPYGVLLLAYLDNEVCGCLALRPLTKTAGEVMRMMNLSQQYL